MTEIAAAVPAVDAEANNRRRGRTAAQIASVRERIGTWETRRQVALEGGFADRRQKQVDELADTLERVASQLEVRMDEIPMDLPSGNYADRLGGIEEGVVWLERLWWEYDQKLVQAEGGLSAFIRAADEVAWSCYEPVLRAVAPHTHRPPPLTCVAAERSPLATSGMRPAAGKLQPPQEVDFAEPLLSRIRSTFIPLLQLPPWCVEAPWQLVFIAHEIGHHVLEDLALGPGIRTAIGNAARQHGSDAAKWSRWADEIFADYFSLLTIGTVTMAALGDHLWGSPSTRRRPSATHPSPALRLALLRAEAQAVGLSGTAADPYAIDGPLVTGIPATPELVDAVVAALRAPLGPFKTLEKICGFQRNLETKVSWWNRQVRGESDDIENGDSAPRRIVAAAFFEWHRLTAAQMNALRKTRAARLLELIGAAAPSHTRASFATPDRNPAALTDAWLTRGEARAC